MRGHGRDEEVRKPLCEMCVEPLKVRRRPDSLVRVLLYWGKETDGERKKDRGREETRGEGGVGDGTVKCLSCAFVLEDTLN